MKRPIVVITLLAIFGCSHPDIREEYDDLGNLVSQVEYKNDLKDNKAIYFYESGDTLEIQHWTMGQLDGPTIRFRKDGTRDFMVVFNKGRTRENHSFDATGKVHAVQYFDNNGFETHEYHYDSSGNRRNDYPFLSIEPKLDQLHFDSTYLLRVLLLNVDSSMKFEYGLVHEGDTLSLKQLAPNQSEFKFTPFETDTLILNSYFLTIDTTVRGDGKTDTIRSETIYEGVWEYPVLKQSAKTRHTP